MEDIEPEEGNAFEEQSFQHHFRKPTKIHGRSREIDQIVRAYQLVKQKETEPKSHLILISGPAGCGKTALATVLREVVEKDDGFFMSWDSDQSHNLSIGGGFDKCFLDFRHDVLSRGSEVIEYVCSRFAAELDTTEMMGVEQLVPAFKEFLPTNRDKSLPSEIETSGIHNKTFRAFFRAMGNHSRPLVQVFNNCQWADANAIHYWTTLLDNADGETQGVLFVATCNTQDEDRSPYWNLVKQILFESDQIELTTIELSDLPKEDFQGMMSDALRAPLESIDASFLASGYETTKGNPRFALELLHDTIVEDVEGVWTSKAPPDSWQNGSLESWLLSRIYSQPEHLQQVLQVCSCFGIRFKADDINIGCSADVSDLLQELIDLGFLICLGRGKYQFANNSIQGAAYNSFQDEARRSAKHFSIGSRLVRFHVQKGTLENNLVMTTGQLLLGIDNVDTYDEKLAVARLCQRAALRCIALKSFHGAWQCLDSAIRLLDCEERRIWRDEYELALTLHNMASEVSYARGHNEDAEDLTKVIMAHARSFNDQLVAISTNLCVFGATKRPSEALELGLATLDKLGEKFPKKPTIRHVAREFHLTWRALRGKSKEALLRLPKLTDKSVAERMTLMNLVFPVAFRLMSKFMPLFAFRCVRLSLKYGVNAISSMGFAIVGLQFCSHIGRYDLGYEFGQVALGLLNRFTAKALTSRVQMVVYGCIHGFTRPLRLAVAPLKQAYWAGLESGDIEFAIRSIGLCNAIKMVLGLPLKKVYNANLRAVRELACVQQGTTLLVRRSQAEALRIQRTSNIVVSELTGIEIHREMEALAELEEASFSASTMLTAFLLDDFQQSVNCASQFGKLPLFRVEVSVFQLVYAMACLALYKMSGNKQKSLVARARKMLKSIDKLALKSQDFCLSKKHLLQAELLSVGGERHYDKALQNYNCAVALAAKEGLLMEEAMAYEATGRFVARCGKNPVAYFEKARSLFSRWDASVKVALMDSKLGSYQQQGGGVKV